MSKKESFQTIAGTKDILPEEQPLWQFVLESASRVASSYSFDRIDTPILEFSSVFKKGTGETTDIVQKEMFSFSTKGGDDVTLRPEGTPPVIRAYLNHGMEKLMTPVKLFYMGAMFRYEKPQQGRRRQLHQFGVECIGEEYPIRDAQVIQIFFSLFQALGIHDVIVEVNTLGCSLCLSAYKKKLKSYYESHVTQLCADCRARYKTNLLRLLDCKDEKCHRMKQASPQILDFLCEDCNTHFQTVLNFLDILSIPYFLNPHLVRGLDYYTRTVFEIFQGQVAEDMSYDVNKRLALASGGRYDQLVEVMGGKKSTPAVGGAMGIERVIECIDEKVKKQHVVQPPDVFIVQLGEKAKERSLFLIEEFRREGVRVGEAFGRDSMTAQLKIADRLGVTLVLIIGQQEVIDDNVIIREMKTGSQDVVSSSQLMDEVRKRLPIRE